jgi:hypothetical protein
MARVKVDFKDVDVERQRRQPMMLFWLMFYFPWLGVPTPQDFRFLAEHGPDQGCASAQSRL